MSIRLTGKYQRSTTSGEMVAAFVPYPLPPAHPPLELDSLLRSRLGAAEQALIRLELVGEMAPSRELLIDAFVRKEAVLSSQIDGTQATLLDLLSSEAGDCPPPNVDVVEICNYLDALAFARGQLNDPKGLPLSVRLLNQTHQRLMRGTGKLPGEIRHSQSWIGGTRPGNAIYIPPPPQVLPEVLSAFELYLHADDNSLPPLVRAGLLLVQVETIQPYLDGNGRMARLLVTLLLEHWKVLKMPLLYMSLFFKRHRDEYYRRLSAVRIEGDWEGWTAFFLRGVAIIAEEAVACAKDLSTLVTADRARVHRQDTVSVAVFRLFEMLPRHPLVGVASVMKLLRTSKPTAARTIATLVAAGVLVETGGRNRDRRYSYQGCIELLRIGTDIDEDGRATR